MIILGHPNIPAPTLIGIKSKEEIANTPPNSVVRFDFDFELLRYCQENSIPCAVDIQEPAQAVYANALGAAFLLCSLPLAKKIQAIADHYLFDAKVIASLDERLIDKAIEAGVDGVLVTNYRR